MARHAELEPRWLVSLLKRWALREFNSRFATLGYASGCGWMRGLKSSPASSIDPTGYSAEDHTDVSAAMDWLLAENKPEWAAVTMYYKPWVIQSFQAEGWPFGAGNKTYYNRLHSGHARIAARMDDVRELRRQVRERYSSGLEAVG